MNRIVKELIVYKIADLQKTIDYKKEANRLDLLGIERNKADIVKLEEEISALKETLE